MAFLTSKTVIFQCPSMEVVRISKILAEFKHYDTALVMVMLVDVGKFISDVMSFKTEMLDLLKSFN